MQLYDLSGEEEYRKKRRPRTQTAATNNSRKKRNTGKAKKELQMIGSPTGSVQRHRKIRADVVTKLDIIGEEEFEEERQERLRRQRIQKQRQREREEENGVYRDTRRKRRDRSHSSFTGKIMLLLGMIIMLLAIYLLGRSIFNTNQVQDTFIKIEDLFVQQKKVNKPNILEDYLNINEYSRPGEALGKVKNIFVHYTANPGTTAKQNRNYFEGLADSGETSASAHFVIGYDGEIIQCIPLQEIGYAVAEHNYDSVSIECCYVDEDGHFTEETYQSLLHLTSWLMGEYHVSADDVLRHFDASGKMCPKYYVEHEDAWKKFKMDLENYIAANGV